MTTNAGSIRTCHSHHEAASCGRPDGYHRLREQDDASREAEHDPGAPLAVQLEIAHDREPVQATATIGSATSGRDSRSATPESSTSGARGAATEPGPEQDQQPPFEEPRRGTSPPRPGPRSGRCRGGGEEAEGDEEPDRRRDDEAGVARVEQDARRREGMAG